MGKDNFFWIWIQVRSFGLKNPTESTESTLQVHFLNYSKNSLIQTLSCAFFPSQVNSCFPLNANSILSHHLHGAEHPSSTMLLHSVSTSVGAPVMHIIDFCFHVCVPHWRLTSLRGGLHFTIILFPKLNSVFTCRVMCVKYLLKWLIESQVWKETFSSF